MNNELISFVKESLTQGLPRPQVAKALADAGWREDEVRAALGLYADVSFPVPVPRRRPYLSAREAFIHLVLFTCLYLSAWSFGRLLFEFVDRAFPEVLPAYSFHDLSGVRMAVSMLVVSFPIYLLLSRLTLSEIRREPDKRSTMVRKWLTYLTLFVAAGFIIGSLIALLFNLLGGEMTTRFFLKVMSILLIAGMIFGYYLWDLRSEEKTA